MHPTSRSRRHAAAALLALGLTVTTGCAGNGESQGAPGSIKIGLLASLSGTYQVSGA